MSHVPWLIQNKNDSEWKQSKPFKNVENRNQSIVKSTKRCEYGYLCISILSPLFTVTRKFLQSKRSATIDSLATFHMYVGKNFTHSLNTLLLFFFLETPLRFLHTCTKKVDDDNNLIENTATTQ